MKEKCFFIGMDVQRLFNVTESILDELAHRDHMLLIEREELKKAAENFLQYLRDGIERAEEECGEEYKEVPMFPLPKEKVEKKFKTVLEKLDKGEIFDALQELRSLRHVWLKG